VARPFTPFERKHFQKHICIKYGAESLEGKCKTGLSQYTRSLTIGGDIVQ